MLVAVPRSSITGRRTVKHKDETMWQGIAGWIVAWICAAATLTELLQTF